MKIDRKPQPPSPSSYPLQVRLRSETVEKMKRIAEKYDIPLNSVVKLSLSDGLEMLEQRFSANQTLVPQA